MNEKEAKFNAFEQLSRIENVRALNFDECKRLGFDSKFDVWEVNSEISIDEKYFPVIFHIHFSTHFPYEIPKIYLSPEIFEKIKFIPHLDNKRLVCTFDSEVIRTNPNDPFGIVNECLNRAKLILIEGINGNNDDDYLVEFKAYWEEKYENESKVKQLLSLINELNDIDAPKLICLNESLRSYKYVLHKSDALSDQLKNFLNEHKIKFTEVSVFYLKIFPYHRPPFYYRNKNILELLKNNNSSQFGDFKHFINGNEYPKLVICKKIINEKDFIFGWFHSYLNTNRKGFRPGVIKPFNSFTNFQSNEIVERISTDIFTLDRLERRTAGNLSNLHRSFAIAGVGSIGSNLLHFLNSFNFPSFSLVDDDFLKIENIGRHLLGFSHINNFKTIALKNHIEAANPLQKITTKEKSIIEVLLEDPDFINTSDFLFVCIGNANIDLWLCQAMKDKVLKIPVFFIWVEPYLCGGHCLYLHPTNPEFEKYFVDGLFLNNIVSNNEYKAGIKDFSMKEAGCQTTFVPYSSNNVLSFLSCLFPKICSIIESGSTKTTSITWLGDIEKLKELNISTSEIINKFETTRLFENAL